MNNTERILHPQSTHLSPHYNFFLPFDYALREHDILCGRGSFCYNHTGNRKFRNIIEENLTTYLSAKTKYCKSEIISRIIAFIRSLHYNGDFIKEDLETRRFYKISEFHVREKISHAFRDALANRHKCKCRNEQGKRRYGSSTKTKSNESESVNEAFFFTKKVLMHCQQFSNINRLAPLPNANFDSRSGIVDFSSIKSDDSTGCNATNDLLEEPKESTCLNNGINTSMIEKNMNRNECDLGKIESREQIEGTNTICNFLKHEEFDSFTDFEYNTIIFQLARQDA